MTEHTKNASPQQPVGWQYQAFEGGRWLPGDDRIEGNREKTVAAGFPVRDVFAGPAQDESELVGLRVLLHSMTCAYREAIVNGHERITFLGGDCDSVEKMLSDFPDYAKARAVLDRQP